MCALPFLWKGRAHIHTHNKKNNKKKKKKKKNFRLLYDFTAVDVKCRVSAIKRLPVLHHSADYTFISFEIIAYSLVVTLKSNTALAGARVFV